VGSALLVKTGAVSEPEWGAWVDDAGAFHYRDYDDCEVVWVAVADLARDWWTDCAMRNKGEWQTNAPNLVGDLIRDGHPASLDVIQSLVDLAETDDELDFVGASPLEDLLSHNGHGLAFVDEVERRARQQPRFRKAVTGVWLGMDVPEVVRTRLAVFGAETVGEPPKRNRKHRK
jgi:hypothetical protein